MAPTRLSLAEKKADPPVVSPQEVLMRSPSLARLALFSLVAFASLAQAAPSANPSVVVETSEGSFEIELFADKAPKSVENFLGYVKSGHYDNTVFHRVMPGFMVQGGGFTTDYARKPTRDPVENEATNGLKNERGTVALARTRVVHSATAQFFVNVNTNPHLDHAGKDPSTYGYAVFGRVTKGMEVVDKIAAVPVGACKDLPRDCPKSPIVIKTVRLVESKPATPARPATQTPKAP
jgi:cyclophilin family peptidyl-prolyl cis-trans isomerase